MLVSLDLAGVADRMALATKPRTSTPFFQSGSVLALPGESSAASRHRPNSWTPPVRYLADAIGGRGIRVNGLGAGAIKTLVASGASCRAFRRQLRRSSAM